MMNNEDDVMPLFKRISLDNNLKSKLPMHYNKWEHRQNAKAIVRDAIPMPFYNSNRLISITFYKPISKIFTFK